MDKSRPKSNKCSTSTSDTSTSNKSIVCLHVSSDQLNKQLLADQPKFQMPSQTKWNIF